MSANKKNGAKEDYLQTFYDFLDEPVIDQQPSTNRGTQRTSVFSEIAREKKLKNDDTEQDITLKKTTLNRLFLFLAIETCVIFLFALFQATHFINFALDEWSFKLLTSVTITQITIMLFVAVSYLFPKHKEK